MSIVNVLILAICAVSLIVVFYTSFKSSENKGAK